MNQQAKPRVVFLLGAGASAEAGVSTTEKITEILVNYGTYCPSEDGTAIENLMKYIQVRIADYLQVRASEVNFEYLLGTLVELSKRQEYPIVPLLGEGDVLVKKLEQKTPLAKVIDKLYALLRELLFVRKPVDYLYPLKGFLEFSKPLDIFTLNYDLSLETALKNLNIPFTVGYRKRDEGLPVWDPSEFGKESFDVRILKLHGSVDWGHYFYYPPPPARATFIAETIFAAERYISNYPERVAFDPFPVGPVEPPERTEGMVSLMNFGTRKELLYASSQFTVLFNHFLNALSSARTCVVAGYSFGDDRINKAVEEAVVTRRGGLHLIIVNPSLSWVEQNYALLWEFAQLGWMTGISKSLGEALQDSSLQAAVRKSKETKAEAAREKLETQSVAEGVTEETGEPDPERILKAWRILGTTFDLTYFWIQFLAPELRNLRDCASEPEAKQVGLVLMPLLRKVRDLCHHIRGVYDEMQFGGTYGGDYLSTIKVNPKPNKELDVKLLRRWLRELANAVSVVCSTYHNSTDEFVRAVTDPNYGKEIRAPSHLHVAELVIRKTKGRIYEMVCVLNDIYKGAGYEEPFEMIANHQRGCTP